MIVSQVRATLETWNWDYHHNPDSLLTNRKNALTEFLADYEDGKRTERYQVASLPSLPFSDNQFGLALCSHLLFLYSEHLSEASQCNLSWNFADVAKVVRIVGQCSQVSHQRAQLADCGRAGRVVGFVFAGGARGVWSVKFELVIIF